MLAASIRIDRLTEPDIWRLVAADDRARRLGHRDGVDAVGQFLFGPAVVLESLREFVEAAGRVRERAAAFHRACHARDCIYVQRASKSSSRAWAVLDKEP